MTQNTEPFDLPLPPMDVLNLLRDMDIHMPALLPRDVERYKLAASGDISRLRPPVSDSTEWLIDGWLPRGCVGVLTSEDIADSSRIARQVLCGLAFSRNPVPSMEVAGPAICPMYVDYDWRSEAPWIEDSGLIGIYEGDDPGRRGKSIHVKLAISCAMYGHYDQSMKFKVLPSWTDIGTSLLKECVKNGTNLLVIDGLAQAFRCDYHNVAMSNIFISELANWARMNNCAVLLVADLPETMKPEKGFHWYDSMDFYWTLGESCCAAAGCSSSQHTLLAASKIPGNDQVRSMLELESTATGYWQEVA